MITELLKYNNTFINLKPYESKIFKDLEIKHYEYIAKEKIYRFSNKYIQELIKIIDEQDNTNIKIEDYLDYTYNSLKKIDKNLNIKDDETLEKLLSIINISKLLLTQGINDNDVECIIQSFFTLESKLNDFNII